MPHPDRTFQRAVFLDKDGTLIKDVPYNVNPDLVVFEDGVFDGLRRLTDEGYKLIIVSNQSGIAIGYFSEPDLAPLIRHVEGKFTENGLLLSGFYYCPHLAETGKNACLCHKPNPGLLIKAAGEHHINLHESWMIGDILNDIEAGNRAGCRTVLIDNGNETEWLTGAFRQPDYVSGHFYDAANYIVSQNVLNYA